MSFFVKPMVFTLLVLSLHFVASCADDNTNDGSVDDSENSNNNSDTPINNNNNNSEPESTTLACDAISWCTSYGSNNADVTYVASLDGGAIQDGLYRLEVGSFSPEALLFDAGQILKIGTSDSNSLGTYSTSGNVLTINWTKDCDESGIDDDIWTSSYDFHIDNDSLFLKNHSASSSDPNNPLIDHFRKVIDLCNQNDDFRCNVTNCGCRVSQGSGMDGSSCY